jgi:glycosyltransferase involved in cell wall biosynthesis
VAERVLYVVNGDEFGGSERVQELLAAGLPAHGFEVGFACVKPGEFARARRDGPWPLHSVGMRSRVDAGVVRRLAAIIRSGGYALVHTHTPRAALVGRPAAALGRVPMVHHVHGSTLTVWPGRLRNWTTAGAERLSLIRVGGVIVVSAALGREWRRLGVPAARIHLAPNGVPDAAAAVPRARPDGEWTLGTMSRLRSAKGIDVLIRALARLRGAGLRVRLVVVGEFETAAYRTQVTALLRELDLEAVVDLRGFRRDVAAELERMDLFVLPSLHEGLPMAVLEAMAAGVPVVASRVGAVTEVIRDGVDGLLVEPGDPDELAAGVARVVGGEADWEAMRASARRRVEERYSAEAMVARVAGVYRRVLRERRSAAA